MVQAVAWVADQKANAAGFRCCNDQHANSFSIRTKTHMGVSIHGRTPYKNPVYIYMSIYIYSHILQSGEPPIQDIPINHFKICVSISCSVYISI